MDKEITAREFEVCMEGQNEKGHASEGSRDLNWGDSASYIVNHHNSSAGPCRLRLPGESERGLWYTEYDRMYPGFNVSHDIDQKNELLQKER